jgi:two-component system, LytTR family, sensor kinase
MGEKPKIIRNNRFLDSRWVQVGLHISLWLLYFTLNYIFIRNYRINIRPDFLLVDMALYIVIFYLLYLVLIPYLLFRKKILWFILLSILLFVGGYAIKKEFREFFFSKMIVENGPGDRPIDMPDFRAPMEPRIPSGLSDSIMFRLPPPRFPEQNLFSPRDLSSLSGILLIFMASIILSFVQKWRKDENFKSEREKERVMGELKYLKQQINPHFLFNSLNSIYSMTISHKSPASDAILKLSSILRYMLYASENEKVSLHNELEVVRNYIELQKLRLTEKVTVKFSLQGMDDNYKIEPHILIPLLENAFKYGVDNISESTIDIRVEIMDCKLYTTISNRIVLKATGMQDSGIGIKNIIRRLELLYPNQYQFNISENDDIFTVKLTITLDR